MLTTYSECFSTSYSLEKYLENDGGVTERLLKALHPAEVVSRVEGVKDKVEMLAQEIIQPHQSSSRGKILSR